MFLYIPELVLLYQSYFPALTVHGISNFLLLWYFFIPEVGETSWISQILDVHAFSPIKCLAVLELIYFHKCVWDWFERSFLVHP